ncbi:unnamed protein product [Allacma fusca]|uniref:Phospholipid scramblase n=1 Tax=Allacma fusca TaxID=39272 RepID=A0A8J2L941_9HEXA|nr:unnamed protein product [Allacma fusca]
MVNPKVPAQHRTKKSFVEKAKTHISGTIFSQRTQHAKPSKRSATNISLDVDNFSESGAKEMAYARLRTITPTLRPLAFTRHVFMRITEHFDNAILIGKRNYEFFNTFGARIYLATVVEPNCTFISHPFETFVWSHDGHAAFKMEGSSGRFGRCAGASVSLPDEFVLASIKQEQKLCKLEYSVLDNKKPVTSLFQIRGPRLDWLVVGGLGRYSDFQIYSASEKYIGKLSHHWDRLGGNFVRDDDSSFRSYGASLPIGMSPNLKAVMMAMLILLDVQFFPNMENRSHIFSNRNRSHMVQTHIIFFCEGPFSVKVNILCLRFQRN